MPGLSSSSPHLISSAGLSSPSTCSQSNTSKRSVVHELGDMAPRKRKSAAIEADTSKSALGGTKGDTRMTGDESSDPFESFEVPVDGKSIICQRRGPKSENPALIFTHGAGGGLDNPAARLFAEGFAAHASIVSFQGTMNLTSRTRSFNTVVDHEKWCSALGGRSMGARAAILASQEQDDNKALVLVSYPLTSPKGDVRDRILLDIPASRNVLFIIGDRDSMCNLDHLKRVRKKMKASNWLLVVKGADHGMSLKPKEAVDPMRKRTGAIAAQWLQSQADFATESVLIWDEALRECIRIESKGKSAAGTESEREDTGRRPRKKRKT